MTSRPFNIGNVATVTDCQIFPVTQAGVFSQGKHSGGFDITASVQTTIAKARDAALNGIREANNMNPNATIDFRIISVSHHVLPNYDEMVVSVVLVLEYWL